LSFLQISKSKQKDNIVAKNSNYNNNSLSNRNNNDTNTNNTLIHLQQTMGNQIVQRMIKSKEIQAKLRVSQPSDPYEIEADKVAEQVMRMPSSAQSYLRMRTLDNKKINRKCKSCEEEEESEESKKIKISRKEDDNSSLDFNTSDNLGKDINDIVSEQGSSLDTPTREFMESKFGYDFGNVRIHTGEKAARTTMAVNAKAYTIGNNIVFSDREFQPHTDNGKKLLGHELVHVIQQSNPNMSRGIDGFEHHINQQKESDVDQIGDRNILNQLEPLYSLPIIKRSFQPTIMRTPIFESTMEICHRVLKSRTFHVSEGGLKVTSNARWEGSSAWQGPEFPKCDNRIYHISLEQEGWLWDSEYGTCGFEVGRPSSKVWGKLPNDDYYLTIYTEDTNPYCCLRGNIIVSQEKGISGETCTRLPPGPLEILHNALDLAGLVPYLGAVPDSINAGLYAIEGDWINAGISSAAILPIFGDAATVGRIAEKQVINKITREAVEHSGSKKIASSLQEARAASVGRQGRLPGKIDEAIEHGIVEEAIEQGPARRVRPGRAPSTGLGESARKKFDQVRDDYATRLGVTSGGQVHHAVELQVLDRYPGVFTEQTLNSFENMRGIATELANKKQLHNSKVRDLWDRHYSRIDREINTRGLLPGTSAYDEFVTTNLIDARDEIDYVLGQFFTEYRTGRPRSFR
jgi:hypothetical protein